MQSRILARETGDVAPDVFSRTLTSHLLRSFAPVPRHRFDGQPPPPPPPPQQVAAATTTTAPAQDAPATLLAHKSGANAIALEKFDGRLLLSGGSDGSLNLWDLEQQILNPWDPHTFRPVASIPRSSYTHTRGITHLAFYPFDPDAFLTSSFDRSLRLWSTTQATPASSFDLEATVYCHATSPIAQHLLVACGTQHPSVRLVDLRSGAAIQALVAHGGSVLATAWSPHREHILASGHADGSIRLWDVRRASGVLGLLDMDDSEGMVEKFYAAPNNFVRPSPYSSAKAHADAVNSLAWTDDGKYIVSAGLDRRIRVWDAYSGANTLTSFGSAIQNPTARHQDLVVVPGTLASQDVVFWPNESEILALDLHAGTVLSRLRTPGVPISRPANPGTSPGAASAGTRHRITGIAWRGAGGHGRQGAPSMGGANTLGGIYAAHADGKIRAWMPHAWTGSLEEAKLEAEVSGEQYRDEEDEEEARRRKKRKALDDVYKNLMGKQVTFT